MRVFLDECVDWRLSSEIPGHQVSAARDMRWTGLKNGELLSRASEQFDAFVTVDRNLAFERNLGNYPIAVVVLRARTNRLADVRRLIPDLLRLLNSPIAHRLFELGPR